MQKIHHPANTQYDLLIVGGGINGVGIAVDAAGRGLSVLLCEAEDLASATSSASSKLIHGGLRYLEQYEFRLVKKALAERETLLNKAPHLISPQRFILPHAPHLRPQWMIKAGLFLYDHLSPRSRLPASQRIKLTANSPLQSNFKTAFSYYDCWVDDARLVIANALAAKAKGATILTQTSCTQASPTTEGWQVMLSNKQGETLSVSTKLLINATGPWAQSFIEQDLKLVSAKKIRLVKGSHLLIKRPPGFDEDAYILQNKDRRVIFVIPYLDNYLMIGTTDESYAGKPRDASLSEAEKNYLIQSYNAYFKKSIQAKDICHHFSGVRPLLDDNETNPSDVTRDYTLVLQWINKQSPLLSVFGGKLTTYRQLAEAVLKKIAMVYPNRDISTKWTAHTPLPGGDFDFREWQNLHDQLSKQLHWLDRQTITRLLKSYGTTAFTIFQGASCREAMGMDFGHGLSGMEVDYLSNEEWATNAEDILWRRSKLGLAFSDEQTATLDSYLSKQSLARPFSQR